MSYKEKAKDFIYEFYNIETGYESALTFQIAKKCALIAVNYLIKDEESYNNGSFYPSDSWQQVKKEIENYEQ